MKLEILTFPDPRLKEISKPVATFDSALHELLDNMAETMYGANGVGLAAPQVGKTIRAFVIDISPQEGPPDTKKLFEFINPIIISGEGRIVFEEGCLSVPGFSEEVSRKAVVTVEYHDRHGEKQMMMAEDLLAVAIQHENDHLDGTLFIDRVSPLKRRLLRRKIEKVMAL